MSRDKEIWKCLQGSSLELILDSVEELTNVHPRHILIVSRHGLVTTWLKRVCIISANLVI